MLNKITFRVSITKKEEFAMMKLYENIKNRRKELNMTQEKLAELLGYTSKAMISKVEKGQVDLPVSKVEEFAAALRTTTYELMGWKILDDSSKRLNLNNEEMDLLDKYRKLNSEHKGYIKDQIDMYLSGPAYKKETAV